jgi:hypothetical protein
VQRFESIALVLVLGLLVCACASRDRRLSDIPAGGPAVGHYRARLDDGAGTQDRFKLLLYAAYPDRLHGEVLSPTGGTVLIFDGGDGRIAVTFVRDRTAYVGPAGREALDKLVGIPLTLEEMVRGLLSGPQGDESYTMIREPDREGLPERLEIRSEGRTLSLQLKRFRALKVPKETLGTGRPPEGMEPYPLDLLEPLRDTRARGGEAP